ncbi:hypothetical protein Tco_0662881 [Tanacetum coccineum]
MILAVEFENASITKDDMRKAYDECSDIPQEKHALIDNFLKQKSDKDYEIYLDEALKHYIQELADTGFHIGHGSNFV